GRQARRRPARSHRPSPRGARQAREGPGGNRRPRRGTRRAAAFRRRGSGRRSAMRHASRAAPAARRRRADAARSARLALRTETRGGRRSLNSRKGIAVSDSQDKTELAGERTKFAEDRTIMAMERTFAGWMRTAFGAIGIGLGFHVMFDRFEPPGLARGIATLFILAGAWLALSAERRACASLARLEAHRVEGPSTPKF